MTSTSCVSTCWVCVAQHWTKRHRRSDRSVACSTHRLCTSKRQSFWAPDVRWTWTKCYYCDLTFCVSFELNMTSLQCCISTHLTFQVSQGSAATDLRWGENFNKLLFHSSFLNIVVKKLRKSVNICQSYRKNKSGTFFMDHGVCTFSCCFSPNSAL